MRAAVVAVVTLLPWPATSAACVFDSDVPARARIACFTSDECPDGFACAAALSRCIPLDAIAGEVCGDGIVASSGNEECDDGDANSDSVPDACRAQCVRAFCGDGVVDGAEACDPADLAPDAPDCTLETCALATCGDGILDDGEECDDGNLESNDACTGVCRDNVCGDGFVDPGDDEECDDNNAADEDGCTTACRFNVCGDGRRNPVAEACDDGNDDDGDDCTSFCALNVCGDGIRKTVSDGGVLEECDDRRLTFDFACLPNCRRARCGDGFLLAAADGGPGEECDDSNASDEDACRTSPDAGPGAPFCVENVCGDGIRDATEEQCDDGNGADGDGCTRCALARCGDGVVNRPADAGPEECDDGNGSSADGCKGNCTLNVCGDGVRDETVVDDAGVPREACDDNNTASFDGCSARCSLVIAEVALPAGSALAAPVASELLFVPTGTGAGAGAGAGAGGADAEDAGVVDGEVHVLAIAVSVEGALHVVDLTEEAALAPPLPLPGPSHAPPVFPNNAGVVPLDQGGFVRVGIAPTAVDAGPLPDVAPPIAAVARGVGVDVVVLAPEPAATPTATPAPGIAWAFGKREGIGMDAAGAAFRFPPPADGSPQVVVPGLGADPNACSGCAPTLVAAGTFATRGAFVPRDTRIHYVAYPLPGVDGGPGAECADPAPLDVPGGAAVVGQVAVTGLGFAYATTTAGQLLALSLAGLEECPPGLALDDVVDLDVTPTGPPAITVDPVSGLVVAFVAADDGSLLRVFFRGIGPLVQRIPVSSSGAPLLHGPVLNRDGDVFVGDAAGFLYGVRGLSVLFSVPLGAPLAGPPRVIARGLVAGTVDGRVLLLENGGNEPVDLNSWSMPFGNRGNTSTAFGEALNPNGAVDDACAATPSSPSSALAPLLVLLLGVRARRQPLASRSFIIR